MTDSELLACPFCGHHRVGVERVLRDGYQNWQDDPDAYAYYVTCAGCACEGPWAKSRNGAVENWNRRAETGG